MEKISLAGQKHTLVGHAPRAIFSPRGPNVPIFHLLPIARGPFFSPAGHSWPAGSYLRSTGVDYAEQTHCKMRSARINTSLILSNDK